MTLYSINLGSKAQVQQLNLNLKVLKKYNLSKNLLASKDQTRNVIRNTFLQPYNFTTYIATSGVPRLRAPFCSGKITFMSMKKKLEYQWPQPLNIRREVNSWTSLSGPFMISKYLKLALSPQSLQEQWCENKFLVQQKWEQLKALNVPVNCRTLWKLPATQTRKKILPWILEIKGHSPCRFKEQ